MNGRHATMALLALLLGAVPATAQVTFESLLEEMIDRGAVARYPDPSYVCTQSSSRDRRSTSPHDPTTWWANSDSGNFLAVEMREGRLERVMFDAEGPGAAVRIWSANPKGTLRIYIDGSDAPAIEAPMKDLLGGSWAPGSSRIGAPLAAVRARARTSTRAASA